MPSLTAWVINKVLQSMPAFGEDLQAERQRNSGRKPPKPPRGVTVTEDTLGGLSAERIEKPGNKEWMLYIHGGGFTTGAARERRDFTQFVAGRYGYNVLAFDYRLAPENKWPAQLEDCLTAYCALEEKGIDPAKIILAGESAGGTLVLSLSLMLKEKDLPLPRAIAVFSPGTNNAEHYPSHSANIKTDTMLRDAVAKGIGEPVFGKNAPESLLQSPYVSPVYGDYNGLPPIFIAASDTEVLYDDSCLLYEKLREEGHRTKLDVQHGVCHAYPMLPMMPEARKSLERCFVFIREAT